ncbi:hypothetical protein Taro_007817 [Colocasia esculenta]|uniref:Uncharacterized protein n=1 Tax=Colocasia esculenta TaxID=4460 RepID=A0A843TVZ6_COLES|nr:hypothetical protein [Colocasia esculenta]
MQYTRSSKRSPPSGLNTGFETEFDQTPNIKVLLLVVLVIFRVERDYEVQEEEQADDGNASD